ncbi:MAG: HEPN domain-containing protein [Infirmifilum sp.]
MPHIDEVRILRRRAWAFYNRAMDSLGSGDYDLAAFLSEQAVQLYLNSLLLGEVGDYPHTHSLSSPISILRRLEKYRELVKLFEDNVAVVRLMEDAYISSRYLPREFTRDEAEKLLSLARKVLNYGDVR